MLDDARTTGVGDEEFIEFATTGSTVTGPYHCSSCGYGVTVRTTLPRCPMCSGETWEQAAWTPFTQPQRKLQ